jgi:hypothetical protein
MAAIAEREIQWLFSRLLGLLSRSSLVRVTSPEIPATYSAGPGGVKMAIDPLTGSAGAADESRGWS